MDTAKTIAQIKARKLVAIFRGDYNGQWVAYAGALLRGGITVMEITLNSPGALAGLATLREALGDQITLGAGTVLTPDEVHTAVDAGATFIVAPDTDSAVIAVAKIRGVAVMPGAYTPTEVKRAHSLGADMVKLFPSQSPAYVKAIHAPLGHIPLMATGGVNTDNAAAFLEAGASALGIGSSLMKPGRSPDKIKARAAALVKALRL